MLSERLQDMGKRSAILAARGLSPRFNEHYKQHQRDSEEQHAYEMARIAPQFEHHETGFLSDDYFQGMIDNLAEKAVEGKSHVSGNVEQKTISLNGAQTEQSYYVLSVDVADPDKQLNAKRETYVLQRTRPLAENERIPVQRTKLTTTAEDGTALSIAQNIDTIGRLNEETGTIQEKTVITYGATVGDKQLTWKEGETAPLEPDQLDQMKAAYNGVINATIVVGPNAAGKGTALEGLRTFGTGDVFRAIMKDSEHPYHKLVAGYVKAGKLVPPEIALPLAEQGIVNDIQTQEEQTGREPIQLILDGAMRNEEQRHELRGLFAELRRNKVVNEQVLQLDAGLLTVLYRTYGRKQRMLKEGKKPRDDDNLWVAFQRYVNQYIGETVAGVVKPYEAEGKVHRVDARQPIPEVRKQVHHIIFDQSQNGSNGDAALSQQDESSLRTIASKANIFRRKTPTKQIA